MDGWIDGANTEHPSPQHNTLLHNPTTKNTHTQDHNLYLHADPTAAANPTAAGAQHRIRHNNNTGRWLSKFWPMWCVRAEGIVGVVLMGRRVSCVYTQRPPSVLTYPRNTLPIPTTPKQGPEAPRRLRHRLPRAAAPHRGTPARSACAFTCRMHVSGTNHTRPSLSQNQLDALLQQPRPNPPPKINTPPITNPNPITPQTGLLGRRGLPGRLGALRLHELRPVHLRLPPHAQRPGRGQLLRPHARVPGAVIRPLGCCSIYIRILGRAGGWCLRVGYGVWGC